MTQLYEYFDVTGGGQTLSGYAFPEVHKFDASAFYNWEQDNLPILDLETRSNVLRQHLGLTDVSGVTLTVSADAPKSASSLGVYQTVQDALAVVPRRLDFPLLIEICDFGNLGDLSIADIHCEGNGGLQIESRQYARTSDDATAAKVASSLEYGPSSMQTMTTQINDSVSDYLSGNIEGASSTNLALTCSSLEGWAQNGRIFVTKRLNSQEDTQNICFSPQYNLDATDLFNGGALTTGLYNIEPYDSNKEVTVSGDADPKTRNGAGVSLISARRDLEVNDVLYSSWWGSYFNKIDIKNCSRVKLKGICVDSASGLDTQYPDNMSYLCDTGISVTNSNILLEGVAVCRVRETGIALHDSTVSVTGDFIIHRVYERNQDKTRTGEGVGVFATDSNLVFNTNTGDLDNGRAIRSISKCGTGIVALNSLITGGALSTQVVAGGKNAGEADVFSSRLYIHGNQTAAKLTNSVYDVDGRTEAFCNVNGLEAYQSTLIFQQFSVDYNQEKGFDLDHSILYYGKDANEPNVETGISGTVKRAFTCDYNGVNLHVDKNSTVAPHPNVSVIPQMDMWGGSFTGTGESANWTISNHGTYGLGTYKAPNIVVSNNSNAELVHAGVAFDGAAAGVMGACAQASENSQLVFRGSSKSHTCLGSFGTVILKNNWTTAAVAAVDNSEVVFTGPTKISRAGVGVLAQNNSRAAFGPPTVDHATWAPAYDKYLLSSTANHTTVDIHANRACAVANEKSILQFKNLGGSSLDALNSTDSVQNFDSSATFVESTSGSFVRLSPNGFTEQLESSFYEADSFDSFGRTTAAITNDSDHVNLTTGGMCVRAVGASKVDVNLVNFRVGDTGLPYQVSGVCYNYNGTGCEFSDDISQGVAGSIVTNICDLVTNCCDPTTTQAPPTTTVGTTPTTTTTTTTTTSTTTTTTPEDTIVQPPPTIEPPTATWIENPEQSRFASDTENTGTAESSFAGWDYEFSCVGSRIHMWNIADTSRLHAANLLLNQIDPRIACIANSFHGPTGRWSNGAACDYYGKWGFAASALSANSLAATSQIDGFYNLGVFRVVGSHRGFLKTYSEVDYQGVPINSQMTNGGSPMDQVNGQGYQTMFDTAINTPNAEDELTYHVGLEPGHLSGTEPVFGRGLAGGPNATGKINGVVTHARMMDGYGMLWDEGELHPVFPLPALHLEWQGYIRNWVDESAVNVFANARHGANKKVNLLSIYRSSTSSEIGGEGRDTTTGNPTFGVGVRSLNMFDLNRLV